jgi:diguanylate cyclase (GGDEF)-like protein
VVVAQSNGAARVGGTARRRDVVVGQRSWQVRVSATASLLDPSDRQAPALTIAAGLIITGLLTVLVGTLAGARNRAMARVDQATVELRKDIERRKAVEAQLQRLALHDPLTDLPNRTLMYERVDHAIASHRRTANSLAVLFIDLDGFKQVNDTHGHQAGDQLLVEVAARLRTCLRAGDTVARLGGDEFAVLAEQITDPAHAATVAAHVVQALQPPFTVAGDLMRVTASVGLVTHCSDMGATTAEEILCRADEAMYAAKTAGKDCYVVAG